MRKSAAARHARIPACLTWQPGRRRFANTPRVGAGGGTLARKPNANSAQYHCWGNANHLLVISHYRSAMQNGTENTVEEDLHDPLSGARLASPNAGTSFLRARIRGLLCVYGCGTLSERWRPSL